MRTTSPLPGLVPPDNSRPSLLQRVRRWVPQTVALETGDTPGRIAILASTVAAGFALGDLVSESGLFGLFPSQFALVIVSGLSVLSGVIMAAGFMSTARTARFTALLTTASIAAYGLASQLSLPGTVFGTIKVAYGVGLLGAVAIAFVRAYRRHRMPSE